MRDDLDAARGVVWWGLVPFVLLLLVASGSAYAAPDDPVRVCRGAVEPVDGQAEGECWGPPTGELVVTTVADMRADDLILGYDYVQDCWCMWFPGTLAANPSYDFRPYEPVVGTLYESFAVLGWGGGGSGEEPTEGGAVIDLEAFGRGWAAAFGLVFACWALGKGVAVVVRLVRN